MVAMEHIVETKITLDAKAASQPYLSASIAVVVPAGIPVNKMDTPIIIRMNIANCRFSICKNRFIMFYHRHQVHLEQAIFKTARYQANAVV